MASVGVLFFFCETERCVFECCLSYEVAESCMREKSLSLVLSLAISLALSRSRSLPRSLSLCVRRICSSPSLYLSLYIYTHVHIVSFVYHSVYIFTLIYKFKNTLVPHFNIDKILFILIFYTLTSV